MMIYLRNQMLLIKTKEDADFDEIFFPPHFKIAPDQEFKYQVVDWENIIFRAPIPKPKLIIPPYCTRIIGSRKGINYKELPQLKDYVVFTQFYYETSIVFWENLILHLDTIYPKLKFEIATIRYAKRHLPREWCLYLDTAQEHFLRHFPNSPLSTYEIEMEEAFREDHMEAFIKSTSKRYFQDLCITSFVNLTLPRLRSLSLQKIDALPDAEEDPENCEYAGIYLVTVNACVLLLQSKAYSSTPNTYMPPKGSREPNERLIDTALRELHEETGIYESDIELIMQFNPCSYYVTEPNFRKKTVVFFVAVLTKQLAVRLSAEHQNYCFASIWDIQDYVKNEHLLTTFVEYHEQVRKYLSTYPEWLDDAY